MKAAFIRNLTAVRGEGEFAGKQTNKKTWRCAVYHVDTIFKVPRESERIKTILFWFWAFALFVINVMLQVIFYCWYFYCQCYLSKQCSTKVHDKCSCIWTSLTKLFLFPFRISDWKERWCWWQQIPFLYTWSSGGSCSPSSSNTCIPFLVSIRLRGTSQISH